LPFFALREKDDIFRPYLENFTDGGTSFFIVSFERDRLEFFDGPPLSPAFAEAASRRQATAERGE
jgi:hypothetical protein